MKNVFYQSSPQHVLREVSADNHITNMTLIIEEMEIIISLTLTACLFSFIIEIN